MKAPPLLAPAIESIPRVPPVAGSGRRVWRAAVLVPVALVVLAGGLRLWRLSAPSGVVADELYYSFDAEAYLGGAIGIPLRGPPPPAVTIRDEGTWVHPPLGKWMIALGEGPLGQRPLGWRLPSAVFGTATVLLVYLLALELWASVWWAGLAGLLLALDGLHVVHSRIAMLDVFLTAFVVAGVYLVVLDRTRGGGSPSPFGSPYRLGAGVMLGAAVATKWSGVLALIFGAALCAAWSLPSARRGERSFLSSVRALVLSFVLVPVLVYLASYTAFFLQHGPAIRDFVHLQVRMLEANLGYHRLPPGASSPLSWPLLLHPIRYFPVPTVASPAGPHPVILAVGNPVLWWGFLAVLPVLVVETIRRPRWQNAVAMGGYAVLYLPWLAVGRTEFVYYMLPAVPFMALAVAGALRTLPATVRRPGGVAFAAAAAVAAAAYAPLWLGVTVGTSWPFGFPLPLTGWR